MKKQCDRFREALVGLAHGEPDQEASVHLESCPACQKLYAQYALVAQEMKGAAQSAPESWVTQALSIFVPQRRSILARLVPSTLAARAAVLDDFQLAFETDEVSARLSYQKAAKGWHVMGRVEGQDWTLQVNGLDLPLDEEGRFTFSVATLANTGLVLVRGDIEIIVPSAEDARENANG